MMSTHLAVLLLVIVALQVLTIITLIAYLKHLGGMVSSFIQPQKAYKFQDWPPLAQGISLNSKIESTGSSTTKKSDKPA